MKPKLTVFLLLVAICLSSANATIIVLVSTYDGFVIVADSRLTLSSAARDRIASDSYQKIVRIGFSTGLAFAGTAFLLDATGSPRNISSLVEDFKIRENISDTTTISPERIAERLKLFLVGIYNLRKENTAMGGLEILIFGYDEHKDRKIYALDFNSSGGANPKMVANMERQYYSGAPGCIVRGEVEFWHRMIKGYDPRLLGMNLPDTLKQKLDGLRYEIHYELMSIQDAIDFGVFIARATIEALRFNQASVMGVGGAIDVATITPEGFKWIQRKKLTVEGKESGF